MLLDTINSPQDLKKLSAEQLPSLAAEIRKKIIDVVSCNGGHIASSLGAVELIIALHYCLNTPKDKIVFDVGHQTYAHKILTKRNKDFATLRQYGGISGFPSKDESEYDTFTTGHSSTAVSLALGLACARDHLKPEEYFKVAAIIGDGSLSGGLCFEGLNNAGHLKKDVLVILNTNELSIAPNVGAVSTYLNKILSMPIYNRFKSSLDNFVEHHLPKGSRLIKIVSKFEEGLKGLCIPGIFFEELGFRYFGPLDGHNLSLLVPTLKNILTLKGPLLLHVVTKKGKGYFAAEEAPVKFHGTTCFDVTTGKPICKDVPKDKTYTEIFSQKIVELAGADKRIVAITAAMAEGTGLDKFRDAYPRRFYDVGIAEGHALCFASGMSAAGFKPVVAIYSTFLQRAYDQIVQDIALQNAAVVFAIDRAGVVGEDGVTHQGIFDIAFLRHIPNLTLMEPKSGEELEMMLEFAFKQESPVAIRYPKGRVPGHQYAKLPVPPLELGRAEVLEEGKDFVIIALGSMVIPSLEALKLLEKEGISGTLINARFVKPLDTVLFKSLSRESRFIFTVEEGVAEGGFGSAVCESLNTPVVRIGLPCEFIVHGRRDILLKKHGLTPDAIAQTIKNQLAHNQIARKCQE